MVKVVKNNARQEMAQTRGDLRGPEDYVSPGILHGPRDKRTAVGKPVKSE